MPTIYVVSDQEGAGKTAVCVGLARLLSDNGKRVSLFKPFSLGPLGFDDPDRNILLDASNVEHTESQLWPVPLASLEDIDTRLIDQTVSGLEHFKPGTDVSIFEGFSGLDSVHGRLAVQVADSVDSMVVAVVGCSSFDRILEGCLDASKVFGERLVGVVINGLTKYKMREIRSQLVPKVEAAGIRVLATIPEERTLLGLTVGQLAEHINGKFVVCEDKVDNFVEHYIIGGMILDWGVLYFERFVNKAVIVRGDRPDIQMAALRTSTSCIVLTGGFSPIQYVEYEAREEGVPLIQVDMNTVDTVAALEGLAYRARLDHPIKTNYFHKLMMECGEWSPLYSSLGMQV